MKTSSELRSLFLEFFRSKGHQEVASSGLVPGSDNTLLFTNAGMVQFKDVFLGRESRPYTRAVTAQRCVRAGGKHNDLENVGYTARHHTFFEMLGNFSFGDYFKREAITYAWEFLTVTLQLPPERLWVTVFDEDREAEQIWLDEVRIDPARFSRIGAKDNFWSMGDIGPCGPCTEIFYDHGPDVPGGPPGSPDADGDRYVEIWNLVFMQYDRMADGILKPLPKPSVDTGMGLERLAAVVQGAHSNYEIDLFRNLIEMAARLTGTTAHGHSSLRVIADHIRSAAFLITDGVIPSNEGRGYVLRRIIRRAIRHGYKLGVRGTFFYQLVEPLCAEMGAAYPELAAARDRVEQTLRREEERFAETLEQGMKLLDHSVKNLTARTIPGETVFMLYDTYGFPADLTADFAREQGLTVDMAGFDAAMAQQRERARAASQFAADYHEGIIDGVQSRFTGYEHSIEDTVIVGLWRGGEPVAELAGGENGTVALAVTPFYAESGGQVGDSGELQTATGVFVVGETQKRGAAHLHHGTVSTGVLRTDQSCLAQVDIEKRQATALNHSATHLLHAALRTILGHHVMQKGSLVSVDRLRFDFSHFAPLAADDLAAIERVVNAQIRKNSAVIAEVMDKDQALALGAMALFGEKYGDQVRVLRIGEFSTELCGGTHTQRAGDIGLFKIVSETGIAAGVRRIEALTGANAVAYIEQQSGVLQQVAELVKARPDQLQERVEQLLDRQRQLEKELERLQAKLAGAACEELLGHVIGLPEARLLTAQVEIADGRALRELAEQLKTRLEHGIFVLSSVCDGKISLIAGVAKELTSRVKAGELVNHVAQQVGGKGGGRPDLAQAGGTDTAALPGALASVEPWVRQRLGA